jgi:hypothetical protein
MGGPYVVVALVVAFSVVVAALARHLSARRRRARVLRRLYASPVPPMSRRVGWVGGDIRPISLDCTRGEDYYRQQRDSYVMRLAQADARRRLAARGLRVDELEVSRIDGEVA